MNRQVRVGQQSKRVADYFAVVGLNYTDNRRKSFHDGDEGNVKVAENLLNSVDSPEFEESLSKIASSPTSVVEETLTPEIVDKYPVKDYHDFSFPEVVTMLLEHVFL